MFFSNLYETVDKPCDQPLAYPLHCFLEKFVNLPFDFAKVSVQLLGLAIVLFAWAIICVFTAGAVYFVVRKLHALSVYFFTQTRLGSRINAIVPIPKLPCCMTNQTTASKKPLISFGEFGSSLASRVHDAKWVKGVFKKRSFGSDSSSGQQTSSKTPSKSNNTTSPSKLVQRISLGSPKLLSLKSGKSD